MNPFDDETREFLALINDEGQYSLWPADCDVPAGWDVVGPKVGRGECLKWIDEQWVDMRPRTVATAMEAAEGE